MNKAKENMMRLGGPLFEKYGNPQEWVRALQKKKYRAAYCPVGLDASDMDIQAYAFAAKEYDILIAEVGAWSNPLSPNETERKAAMDHCRKSLALAEKIGARCCVNIAGSRGAKWDGPCAEDLTETSFDMVVETVREIIDAVKPTQTCYALETMPWMYPDSVESYLRLIHAIDRKSFAVHFDPVNLISSPQLYFQNGSLIQDFIDRLGPHIKSCHAKDILLQERLTVHLDEARPGYGGLDYRTFLLGLSRLGPGIPVMLEHLEDAQEYDAAADFIRLTASQAGIQL
jgi:sugar phosphate isomerase/epimerase